MRPRFLIWEKGCSHGASRFCYRAVKSKCPPSQRLALNSFHTADFHRFPKRLDNRLHLLFALRQQCIPVPIIRIKRHCKPAGAEVLAAARRRTGRIVRQGNQNPEVEIFRYVTEGTFDAYLYQLVESKQRFIAQIMTSKLPARAAEDVDETALSYAEIKALATGNPQIIEKCNLDMEVSKLNMLRASHLSQRYALEELVLRKYPAEIKELNERIAGYEQDSARLAEHPKPAEGIAPMVLNDVTYADRKSTRLNSSHRT